MIPEGSFQLRTFWDPIHASGTRPWCSVEQDRAGLDPAVGRKMGQVVPTPPLG